MRYLEAFFPAAAVCTVRAAACIAEIMDDGDPLDVNRTFSHQRTTPRSRGTAPGASYPLTSCCKTRHGGRHGGVSDGPVSRLSLIDDDRAGDEARSMSR